MTKFKPTEEDELVGPQLAVQRYLEELLQEATITHLNESADVWVTEETEDLLNDDAILDDSHSDALLVSATAVEPIVIDESEFTNDPNDKYEESNESLYRDESELRAQALKNTDKDEYDYEQLDAAFADFEEAVQHESLLSDVIITGENLDTQSSGDLFEVNNIVIENVEKIIETDEFTVDEVEIDDITSDEVDQSVVLNDASFDNFSSDYAVVPVKINKPKIKTDLDDLLAEDLKKENTAPIVSKTDPLPWAKSRFECLLFKVGGLKMAVPLVELGGIQKADKTNVTPLFGQPRWFLGVASVHKMHIRTVDTALWVMPDHYKGDLRDNFKFVIQLDRSDWGLACEVVAEAISLEPSAVKWRSDRTKRPWLAGTVIEHMCAILDVQGFIELLDDPKNGFKAHLK